MLRTCPGSFLGNMETKIGFIIVLAKKLKIFFEVFVKIVLHIYFLRENRVNKQGYTYVNYF